MGAKWLIMIVATVVVAFWLPACATMPNVMAGERLVITINPNGRVASVTDEKGMPIPKISVNQDNHIGDLLAKFPTKKAKKGVARTIAVFGASPGCVCYCQGPQCWCSPPGC